MFVSDEMSLLRNGLLTVSTISIVILDAPACVFALKT